MKNSEVFEIGDQQKQHQTIDKPNEKFSPRIPIEINSFRARKPAQFECALNDDFI